MLDNECPAGLKQVMQNDDVAFQLVPPHLHSTNVAERAIATYKDHIIAGLNICDPSFPLHLWDRLIPQTTLFLILLRQSWMNPCLSAEAQLNGAFDFNCTPLAPPSTKFLVFEDPGVRRTWPPHGVTGWYISRAPEHYRCYRVYIPKTRADRIINNVECFPYNFTVPIGSSADAAVSAVLQPFGIIQFSPRPCFARL